MIVVTIDPVIFSVGPLQVRWFGLLVVAATLGGLALLAHRLGRANLPSAPALDAAALALPVGVLCARLFHVLSGWDYYFTAPDEIWQVNLGGLSLWGGLLGGGLAIAWSLRRDHRLRISVADVVAPVLGLALASGAVGSFIDGDGVGTPSSLPWATQYTSDATMAPDFGIPRHPVQLYLGLGALVLALIVFLVPRAAAPGLPTWVFLLGLGALRLALSPLLLQPPFVLDLQLDQIVASLVVLWSALQLCLTVVRGGWRGDIFRGGLTHERAA